MLHCTHGIIKPNPLVTYSAYVQFEDVRTAVNAGWRHAGFDPASGLHIIQCTDRNKAEAFMDDDDLDAQEVTTLVNFCEKYDIPMPYIII